MNVPSIDMAVLWPFVCIAASNALSVCDVTEAGPVGETCCAGVCRTRALL